MVIQSDPDHIVIKSKASLPLKAALSVVAAGCVVAGLYVAYELGLRQVRSVQAESQSAQQRLEGSLQQAQLEIEQLKSRNQELLDSLSKADRQLQVDKIAYSELASAVSASTDEIAALREELEFYRNIVSSSDGRSGVQIQDLEIQRAGGDRQYRYTVVVIQSLQHDQEVRGTVELAIEGSQNGQEEVLHLPEEHEEPIEVSFKYFQKIDGNFALPSDYTPRRIKVSVHTASENALIIERWYPWPSV